MVGFLVFMVTVVLGILAMVGGLQWIQNRGSKVAPAREDAALRRQLEQVEGIVLSLESRLDQLQEQQRFLEKLLAGRTQSSGPSALSAGSHGDERTEHEETETGVDSILFDTGRDAS